MHTVRGSASGRTLRKHVLVMQNQIFLRSVQISRKSGRTHNQDDQQFHQHYCIPFFQEITADLGGSDDLKLTRSWRHYCR